MHVQLVDEGQRPGQQQVLQQLELAALQVEQHLYVVASPHVRLHPRAQVQRLQKSTSFT